MGLKVVVIGGGSSYTPELVEGIINRRESLPVTELVLVDIEAGETKVAINTRLVRRMFEKVNISIVVSYTLDRLEALPGADFVMSQFRVGGLEARAKDEKIPLAHGMIGQETTGPGGFAKALRTIPVVMDICRDIEVLCPKAWLINFTNPSGMVTEAVCKHTNVKSIGLCNVPINMVYDVAEKLGVAVEALDCHFVGLNHLSFMDHAWYEGVDRLSDVLAVESSQDIVKNIEKVEEVDELARIFRLMPSPYMQYFYFEKDMIAKETEELVSGAGTRAEQVMEVEKALFEKYNQPSLAEKPEELLLRGGARYSEAAIHLIDSIYNDTKDVQVVNVVNGDTFAELPLEAVIETNCVIGSHGAIPLESKGLPKSVKGLIQQVKMYEQLTIEAAMTGNKDTALIALMNNPLVHNAREAKSVLSALIEGHQPYLDYLL